MKCPIETPESAEMLMAYCSRKLDSASMEILQDHIETCPACRRLAQSQRTVWDALDAWEAPPVSADFDRRLYERIEQNVTWWDRLVRPFRPMSLRHGVPVTAVAALLVAAGVLLENPARKPAKVEPAIEVAPEQAEDALEAMEVLHEFSRFVRPETAGPKM